MRALSRGEALLLAALLAQFLDLLPTASRIAVCRYTETAVSALKAFVGGRALERQAVVTALVFIELEIRRLGRVSDASQADTAERERLWGEIESIAGGI